MLRHTPCITPREMHYTHDSKCTRELCVCWPSKDPKIWYRPEDMYYYCSLSQTMEYDSTTKNPGPMWASELTWPLPAVNKGVRRGSEHRQLHASVRVRCLEPRPTIRDTYWIIHDQHKPIISFHRTTVLVLGQTQGGAPTCALPPKLLPACQHFRQSYASPLTSPPYPGGKVRGRPWDEAGSRRYHRWCRSPWAHPVPGSSPPLVMRMRGIPAKSCSMWMKAILWHRVVEFSSNCGLMTVAD